ncbi:MAG: hypothetical protein WB698_04380 [Solirubrobacteraceae bacterium]
MALAALLGALSLLGAGTVLAVAAQAAAPAHQASSKTKGKGKKKKSKGKKGKSKGKKKKSTQPAKKAPSVTLTGGTATISLSSGAASSLEKAKVTLTATAPATLPAATQVSLPVTGGTLTPSTGEGTVDLGGGFTFLGPLVNLIFFTSQSAVSLQSPVVIKLGSASSSNLSANVGEPPLDAPFFTLKPVKATSSSSTVTLSGIGASLDSAAAEVMTKAFSGATFTTSESFASITITANTAG